MEPLINLKRTSTFSTGLCIICQQETDENLVENATDQGIASLEKSTTLRLKCQDFKYRDASDRLLSSLRQPGEKLTYHRSCYIAYTNKTNINRLNIANTHACNTDQNKPRASRRGRSGQPALDWTLCLFCQKDIQKETLRSVLTQTTSQNILSLAAFDQTLRVSLSCVNDLMAAEGKYHLPCYSQFKRKANKSEQQSHICGNDIIMVWLAKELKNSANNGDILDLHEVWERYCAIAKETELCIPVSFNSRLGTFKKKLTSMISTFYEVIVLRDGSRSENRTVLIPVDFKHIPISLMKDAEHNDALTMPAYHADDGFLQLVHMALKLRADIMNHPVYDGFTISEDKALACVPDSVYMFIQLMMNGQSIMNTDTEEKEEGCVRSVNNITLSIAQDLVYNVTGGKHWTPKHVGLASTLHQATRSKQLVQLFHNAGHMISYDNVLQVDTALAESTLQSMDTKTGAVIPPNLQHDKFVHFTCDNIDINDFSFDGKNTFHATQVAAWQRGADTDMSFDSLAPSSLTTLKVPLVMEELLPASVVVGTSEPRGINTNWYSETSIVPPSAVTAIATDMAFFIKRQDEVPIREGWTQFNELNSHVDPEMTTLGYMPIIQAPAHELDTLNTVVQRCKQVANTLGQQYVVLTVDEALYCKLMEIKWANKEFQACLILRLGGLHTSMNFLKIIGKHVRSSGLLAAWVDSKVLGPLVAEQVAAGKCYSRAIRTHKLTLQAMWRIVLPRLLDATREKEPELTLKVKDAVADDNTDRIIQILETPEFQTAMDSFSASHTNANYRFWWSYMKMVSLLLMYIRAQREGCWELHLHAFKGMLPWFMRYDHVNYARWGTVYISEMMQLPSVVLAEFEKGNFVVKMSKRKFNQVDPDQSQEWLNGIGKSGGGIVGITKTASALARWTLSYNLRSQISCNTRKMFSVCLTEYLHSTECSKARQTQDNNDENNLMATLLSFHVFHEETSGSLQNIATKDVATKEIEHDLLNAMEEGKKQLRTFVEERLLIQSEEKNWKRFRDPIKRNNSKTFSSMYDVAKKNTSGIDRHKTLKVDRTILQRLLTASQAGRSIDLREILSHELLPVPISLAEMNGRLRTGSKAVLYDVFTADIDCPSSLPKDEDTSNATLIIDGQAMVNSIGKPQGIATFGDLSDIFVKCVLRDGVLFSRIDVLFDRYSEPSIKMSTRQRRTCANVPIRRVIEGRNIPLPANWLNFMALANNKADLEHFLSNQLIENCPETMTIVVSGGFLEEETVKASNSHVNIDGLEAMHEEADTRIILHCVKSQSDTLVIHARDTDVLVLLISHFHRMASKKVWMKAGTAKKRKYIPIHTVVESLPFGPTVLETLPAFHAITGSDTTSYIAGHTKLKAWKVFVQHNELLKNIGNGELSTNTVAHAEEFICKLYNLNSIKVADEARAKLFVKSNAPEALPPTTDALCFHIKRAHYQALIWRQAYLSHPILPPPELTGWRLEEQQLQPILMSLPAVPESCIELITCGCLTACRTLRCKCRKVGFACTPACKCREGDNVCCNDYA